MANKAGTRTDLGTMACNCCAQPIPVRQSDTGTVNASCPWCEVQTWAKRGTRAHGLILARVKADPAAAPAPAAQAPAQAVPKPAPAPAKGSSVFHF